MREATSARMRVVAVTLRLFAFKSLLAVRMIRLSRTVARKLFLRALRYWRVIEFPYTIAQLPAEGVQHILDISSPKILALHLAHALGHRVTAIDIWHEEILFWGGIVRSMERHGKFESNLRLLVADGTRLPFPDNHFDFVYSVSVVEHIDGKGDSLAMREIARVLRPGATAVVTVPYDETGYDVFRHEKVYHKEYEAEPVFYERWYSSAQLLERLVKPSGLVLVNKRLVIERFVRLHNRYLPRILHAPYPIRNLWSLLEPFIALANLCVVQDMNGRREGVALLALRKPATT